MEPIGHEGLGRLLDLGENLRTPHIVFSHSDLTEATDLESGGCIIIGKSFDANKYLNDAAPWNKKDDKKRLDTIVYVSLEIIRKISILLLPIIPYSANKAFVSLNLSTKTLKLSSITDHLINKSGTKIKNQGILFKKIEKNND